MRISDWSSDVCSSDLRAIAFVPDFCRTGIFGGRNLNVLGNVHDNRTRTTRSGDMKRLVDDMAEFRRVLHQIIMLGAMAGEADRVRFLKGVSADQVRRNLTGKNDHGDAVHQRIRDAGYGIGDRNRVVKGKGWSVRVDRGGG